MNKVKAFFKGSGKKIFAITMAITMLCSMAVATFATDPTSGEAAVSEMNTAVTGALSDLNVTNLASIIVAGLAIAVPLVLAWFAFRWVYRKAKGGLKSGR